MSRVSCDKKNMSDFLRQWSTKGFKVAINGCY
jgi:hypothetical protein